MAGAVAEALGRALEVVWQAPADPPCVAPPVRPSLAGPAAYWPGAGQPHGGRLGRLAQALQTSQTSSVELVRAALERATGTVQGRECIVAVDADGALAAAGRADAELAVGRPRGPLHGVPTVIKDTIDVAGLPTSNGCAGSAVSKAAESAGLVRQLESAGAIVIGKSRTPPLAWSSDTPGVSNPHDSARSAGGSSGGSAVAVAAGIVPFAIGTDTCGSIRIPAALCGTVGLKPTHGLIELTGVSPLAASQDVAGPIAATVDDCLTVLHALAAVPASRPADWERLTVLMPTDNWASRVDERILTMTRRAAAALRAQGVAVVEVELPAGRAAPAVAFVTMLAEASWWWSLRVAGNELGETLSERLSAGQLITARDYLQARQVAAAIGSAVASLLGQHRADALLVPTTPVPAPLKAETEATINGRREPIEAALTRLTALASVTGLPAFTVGAGETAEGLPIGVQLIGGPWTEDIIGRLACLLEQSAQSPHLSVSAK